MAVAWTVVLLCSSVLAAYTDEFLQAFNNLGLDQWTGIEMDVAWGHVTSQYGLHRPSVTGPIFVYGVCTTLRLTTPGRSQILTHANLSPEQVLSAIAGHFPDLDTVLRQRFPDMLRVGFEILTVHPSSKWLDPTFSPQKEKVVIVYSDEFLRRAASVLLRLSLPLYDEEGAIYVQRRLRLRALVRQLGLSPLCGQDGENCLCFVNGIELANEIDAAVEDAAFIHCWMLPLVTNDEVELVSIEDTASVRSADSRPMIKELALSSLVIRRVGTNSLQQYNQALTPLLLIRFMQKGKGLVSECSNDILLPLRMLRFFLAWRWDT